MLEVEFYTGSDFTDYASCLEFLDMAQMPYLPYVDMVIALDNGDKWTVKTIEAKFSCPTSVTCIVSVEKATDAFGW